MHEIWPEEYKRITDDADSISDLEDEFPDVDSVVFETKEDAQNMLEILNWYMRLIAELQDQVDDLKAENADYLQAFKRIKRYIAEV